MVFRLKPFNPFTSVLLNLKESNVLYFQQVMMKGSCFSIPRCISDDHFCESWIDCFQIALPQNSWGSKFKEIN